MMTNKERYQKTFSHLQMSAPLTMEDIEQAKTKKKWNRLQPVLAGALSVLLVSGMGAYAVDLGGIRTALNGWFEGRQVDIYALSTSQGGYEFYDSQTGEFLYGGGGIEYGPFGRETALDASEVARNMESGLYKEEDGSIIYADRGNRYDLSPLLRNSDTCSFVIHDNEKTLYFDVKIEDGGNAMSLESSPTPQHAVEDYALLEPQTESSE